VLNGLSPKENREVPPLQYHVAARMCAEFPHLTFVVNGGIRTVNEVHFHLQQFCGVMIGREAYHNPYVLAELHQHLHDHSIPLPDRGAVVDAFASYVGRQCSLGERPNAMVRHMLGLYNGLPGARSWRRFLSENTHLSSDFPRLLVDSLRIVEPQAA